MTANASGLTFLGLIIAFVLVIVFIRSKIVVVGLALILLALILLNGKTVWPLLIAPSTGTGG